MKKLFVGSLPPTTTEDSLQELFSQYGKVHSLKLVKDLFTGHCRGMGFIEMEGHEARAAIAGLNGQQFEGNQIRVNFEKVNGKGHSKRRR